MTIKGARDAEFSPALLDFIRRRTMRFIEPHKSLEIMFSGAYLQGMQDALDALGKLEVRPAPKEAAHHDETGTHAPAPSDR